MGGGIVPQHKFCFNYKLERFDTKPGTIRAFLPLHTLSPELLSSRTTSPMAERELRPLSEILEDLVGLIRDGFLRQLEIAYLELDLIWDCLEVLRVFLWILRVKFINCLVANSTWFEGFFYILPAFVVLIPEILDTVF